MNRKIVLITLLISSIYETFVSKAYASSDTTEPAQLLSPISGKSITRMPDSPAVVVPRADTNRLKIMAQAIKDEEDARQQFLDKIMELNRLLEKKDAEIAMLKEKIAESGKIITEQTEEINTLRQIFSNVQNALIRK